MQLAFFTALKTKIEETLPEIKKVGLWNNQFENERKEISFGYPCCFIEFNNIIYSDLLNAVQRVEMDIYLHLGFESYKTEDTEVLALKQRLFAAVHQFQQGTYTKMLRRSEMPNYDHPNVQEYIISYHVLGKDDAGVPAMETANITTAEITVEPKIDNHVIMTGKLT